MNRRLVRNALAAASLATLAACVVNISFQMDKTFAVKSDPSAPTTIAQTQAVNLLDYKDVADHRDNIKSLDLDYAEAKVTAITAGSNTATKVSGTLKLRKTAADTAHDVVVGTLTNVPVTVGSTTRLNGTPALDQFLMDALKGDGKFIVVIDGTVDGQADLTLDVQMHASVGYDAGIL